MRLDKLALGGFVWLAGSAVGTGGVAGQESGPAVVRPSWTDVAVRRSTSQMTIDARLDEAAWSEAESITLPWETSPLLNTEAPVATDCRITFDSQNLYFACVASDGDPSSIRAYLADRDQTDGQDEIGLLIDPFRDSRRAFGFNLTPLGVQSDWVFDGGQGNDAWDAIWDSKGRLTDDGYVIEASIPFKSLRFPATSDVQSWGFYFWRSVPRSVLVSTRSVPRDPSNQCALCQMAFIQGFEGIGGGTNVELIPFTTVQRTDSRSAPLASSLETGKIDDQYGLDVRYSITSEMTVNVTANPDFSQVEADVPQLQSNQQFALFFPERRPFFLEGAEFFETPLRAVFTRTIADPTVGAKVTGKAGAWAFGALSARDQRTNLLLPGPQSSRSTSIDAGNTSVMARARRDVGGSSTAGVLLTARGGGGYRNLVVGADTRIQVHQTTTITAQLLRSETEYPEETAQEFEQPSESFSGWSWITRAEFERRNGWIRAFAKQTQAGFRADGGFIAQADYQQYDLRARREFWTDAHPFFTSWWITGGGGRFQQTDGTLIGEFVFSDIGFGGPLQSELTLNPDRFRRQFEGEQFTINRLNIFGTIKPTGRLGFDLFWQLGEELDFANARKSGLARFRQGLDIRLGRSIELELDYDLKRLTHQGRRVFREQVSQARGVYHFTDRMFFRGIVQLREVDRDPSLFRSEVEPRSRSLDTQFLLSYKLNPQSVVFLGYSDASAGVRENQDPTAPLDLTRLSRSFFLKLSYAWRP